jgi:glycosyltransferase involved in cell wall biosynthesis
MKINSPLISIVIPCYNDYQFVEQAVQSAILQTCTTKEIIIVDDGSNQRTKEVLKGLEPNIDILITQENKGPAAARNLGISEAKGEYILVLDSDDYFEPEFCKRAIEKFEADQEIKMVTCYARWFKSDKDFQIFKPSGGQLNKFLVKNSSLGTMFKKSDWENTGGYDEKMRLGYEDWEFYIRIHKDGGKTYVIPDVLFHYRKRKFSRNNSANKYKYDLLEYIYVKHRDLYQENFLDFINAIIKIAKEDRHQNLKLVESMDYKLGNLLLRPLRFLKSFIRSIW